MKRILFVLLIVVCAAQLSAQDNDIKVRLGGGGSFKILKSNGSTEVFTVRESDGFAYATKVAFTPEGGIAVKIKNKSGGTSQKGTIIAAASSDDNAFTSVPASSDFPAGV